MNLFSLFLWISLLPLFCVLLFTLQCCLRSALKRRASRRLQQSAQNFQQASTNAPQPAVNRSTKPVKTQRSKTRRSKSKSRRYHNYRRRRRQRSKSPQINQTIYSIADSRNSPNNFGHGFPLNPQSSQLSFPLQGNHPSLLFDQKRFEDIDRFNQNFLNRIHTLRDSGQVNLQDSLYSLPPSSSQVSIEQKKYPSTQRFSPPRHSPATVSTSSRPSLIDVYSSQRLASDSRVKSIACSSPTTSSFRPINLQQSEAKKSLDLDKAAYTEESLVPWNASPQYTSSNPKRSPQQNGSFQETDAFDDLSYSLDLEESRTNRSSTSLVNYFKLLVLNSFLPINLAQRSPFPSTNIIFSSLHLMTSLRKRS